MLLYIILGAIVLITFVVLGVLFYTLSNEGKDKEDDKVVPLTNFNQHKNDLPSASHESQTFKASHDDSEVIPASVPKSSPATGFEQTSLEDDASKKRIQALEDELRAIKQKSEEQADVTREMVLSLTKENQTLKARQAEAAEPQEKSAQIETELANLKAENVDLKAQLESANAKKSEPDEALRLELESLKSQQIPLQQKCEGLEYELVKARAQSSGLERVNFNYKNQVEDFLKKVDAMQVSNDQMSQAKNKLEAMVEEIKLQNEELVKKDNLAQFELEKNRSHLVDLERENGELKARLQQQNQQ